MTESTNQDGCACADSQTKEMDLFGQELRSCPKPDSSASGDQLMNSGADVPGQVMLFS